MCAYIHSGREAYLAHAFLQDISFCNLARGHHTWLVESGALRAAWTGPEKKYHTCVVIVLIEKRPCAPKLWKQVGQHRKELHNLILSSVKCGLQFFHAYISSVSSEGSNCCLRKDKRRSHYFENKMTVTFAETPPETSDLPVRKMSSGMSGLSRWVLGELDVFKYMSVLLTLFSTVQPQVPPI